jgi:hypothetical protein
MVVSILLLSLHARAQDEIQKKKKKFQFEEVDFEDMMRRYFQKEQTHNFEGVYSVSCTITKRKKVFLSKREKFRILERQDNYARVAILKDWPASKREFIEISLSNQDGRKYPIVGEMDGILEGSGLIYKHIEPDGSVISFTMMSESPELLEGEFSTMKGRKTITYRLSYLRIFPKTPTVVHNK